MPNISNLGKTEILKLCKKVEYESEQTFILAFLSLPLCRFGNRNEADPRPIYLAANENENNDQTSN